MRRNVAGRGASDDLASVVRPKVGGNMLDIEIDCKNEFPYAPQNEGGEMRRGGERDNSWNARLNLQRFC